MKLEPIDLSARRPAEPSPEVRRAARGLEEVMLRQMLAAMERAQLENGLFGDGAGAGARGTAFQLMLSEALAAREPFGLAERVASQLGQDRRAADQLAELAAPAATELIGRPGAGVPVDEKMRRHPQVLPAPAEEESGETRLGPAAPASNGEKR